ncbi:MAG: hypothetical protein WCJ35_04785 [Planctomycetota bacterium]
MPTYRLLAAMLFLFFGTALIMEAARAADFRVDNAIYVEGQSQPQSEGVTIFHEGLVYDFLNEPAEVILFDKAHRRFTLLDIGHHVRSEISIDDVQAFVNRVKQRLSGHSNPNMKWLADPSFEESFIRETSELTLKSTFMTYQAQVQSTVPAVAAQYHEFSDWYAQFNFAVNPKSRPPFPRMMLNEAIDRSKGIAKEVHLTTALSPKDVPTKITSRHQLVMQLDSADRNRVAEAREYQRSFQSVSFRDYREGK